MRAVRDPRKDTDTHSGSYFNPDPDPNPHAGGDPNSDAHSNTDPNAGACFNSGNHTDAKPSVSIANRLAAGDHAR